MRSQATLRSACGGVEVRWRQRWGSARRTWSSAWACRQTLSRRCALQPCHPTFLPALLACHPAAQSNVGCHSMGTSADLSRRGAPATLLSNNSCHSAPLFEVAKLRGLQGVEPYSGGLYAVYCLYAFNVSTMSLLHQLYRKLHVDGLSWPLQMQCCTLI